MWNGVQCAKWKQGMENLMCENVNGRAGSQVPGEERSQANMVNTGAVVGDCVAKIKTISRVV